MQWVKTSVGGVPKMLNMANFESIEEDPGDSSKCVLTRADATTVSIDAEYDQAVIFFAPLLYKEDILGNPL